MFPKFVLIIFASCVGGTPGKKWLIETDAIQKHFIGRDANSLELEGESCNYHFPYMNMISQSEIRINKRRSVCYFQPDFNILCQHNMNVVTLWDPLGCKSKLTHTHAPNTFSRTTTTMNTQSFPIASSETEELTSWQCVMNHEMQCNGLSMCLTDECQCADIDVFFCADGVGALLMLIYVMGQRTVGMGVMSACVMMSFIVKHMATRTAYHASNTALIGTYSTPLASPKLK